MFTFSVAAIFLPVRALPKKGPLFASFLTLNRLDFSRLTKKTTNKYFRRIENLPPCRAHHLTWVKPGFDDSMEGTLALVMNRALIMGVLLAGVAPVLAGSEAASPDKVRSNEDFGYIQREVETLRGKKFLHDLPVYRISRKGLQSVVDRDIAKQWPGDKLEHFEELLAWMDMAPPDTDLKKAYGSFFADQVEGFYDDDTKEICIPDVPPGNSAAEKKMQQVSPQLDGIVLSHEYTHALEDQYWPLTVPADNDDSLSTDRGTAHQFTAEGSATREMLEAVPDQLSDGSPTSYFGLWNLIHSPAGEFLLDSAARGIWKSSDLTEPDVPETLARDAAIPYAYGYCFCAKILRDWGLDGLDYIYEHPPVSSSQVMHPEKAWEWREFPVQIALPDSLPGGWKQMSIDCEGEADVAILFGCQLHNLNRGLQIARGWDGDHAALYENADGRRLLIWASSWDSDYDAGVFFGSCIKERQLVHHASITVNEADRAEWTSPDGRNGSIRREGKRVILVETDDAKAVSDAGAFAEKVSFTESPERAARDAANSAIRRFNPIWSSQKDGDYEVTRSLGGILSRHDRNSIGAADTFLFGLLAEFRRTTSFDQWEFGGGLIINHEAEARRGFSKTTLLPWGMLASHCVARYPQEPEKTISRTSVLWGVLGSVSRDAAERHSIHVLPFGLLFDRITGPGLSFTHVLGTGVSRENGIAQVRVLGVRVWSGRKAQSGSE
jgi:hypothetical protein